MLYKYIAVKAFESILLAVLAFSARCDTHLRLLISTEKQYR